MGNKETANQRDYERAIRNNECAGANQRNDDAGQRNRKQTNDRNYEMAMFSHKLSLYCQMGLYYGMQMVSGLDMRACSFVIYGVLYNADVCGEKFPVTTAEFAQ